MTTGTIADDIHVIEVRGQPPISAVAIVASVAAGDVRQILAGGCDTVMAGTARPDNLVVIDHHRWREDIGGVAVFADSCCLNVGWVLADRFRTVVTANTIAGDIDVIEIRRQPADRAVTVVAGVAAAYVSRVLTRCSNAIVTGTAGTNDLCVVDSDNRHPNGRAMAVLAYIGCLNMCLVLAGCFNAIVAADAVTRDAYMIKICRDPASCPVTVVAGVAAGDVRRMLSGRTDTVVATDAVSNNAAMIEYGR